VLAVGFFVNIALNLLFVDYLAHGGLAVAMSISAILSTILLFVGLKRKMDVIGATRIIKTFFKVCVASDIMGIAAYYVFAFSSSVFYGTTVLNAVVLAVSVGISL